MTLRCCQIIQANVNHLKTASLSSLGFVLHQAGRTVWRTVIVLRQLKLILTVTGEAPGKYF